MKVEVYSDGSSDGKSGGIGGWAYVIVVDGAKIGEGSGSILSATNNVAEIQAAYEALEAAQRNQTLRGADITLVSDSQLVLRWATGEYEVKKPHLIPHVMRLRKVFSVLNANTRWERGHSGEPNNERCDELAKSARRSQSNTYVSDPTIKITH